jgi:hypothetical protein
MAVSLLVLPGGREVEGSGTEATMSDLYRIDREMGDIVRTADLDFVIDDVDHAIHLGVLVPVEMEDGGSGIYEEHSDPAYIGRRFQIWFEHPDEIVLTPDEQTTLDRTLDRMEKIGGDDA